MKNDNSLDFEKLVQDTIDHIKDNSDFLYSKEPISIVSKKNATPQTERKQTPLLSSEKKQPAEKKPLSIEKAPPPLEKKIESKPQQTIKEKQSDFFHPFVKDSKEPCYNSHEQLLKKFAPELSVQKSIPSDFRAKEMQNQWKYRNQAAEVSILSYKNTPDTKKFLQNVAGAIQARFLPCRVIDAHLLEETDHWEMFLDSEKLELIIASDYFIFSLKRLMKNLKEDHNTKKTYLKDIPLLILPDTSLYLKEPRLKASLWKTLKNKIEPLAKKE